MTGEPTDSGAWSRPVGVRRWWALAVLASAQFMIVANITIVNIALSSVQAALRLSNAELAWVVNAYLLAAGGIMLLGGRLGDLLGRRRVFGSGMVLFAAASLAAGAAQNPAMLVACRFAQGVGVALAAPAALALVVVLFPAGMDRARALGVWGGLGALGSVAGLLLSGLLTDLVGWRWVFLVNVPVAALVLAVLPRLVDESHAPGGRLDLTGAIMVTGGLVSVVAGLLAASSHSWGEVVVLRPLLGGAAVLAVFVLVELRAPDPLLPPAFFANRVRLIAALAVAVMTSAMAVMFLLLTLYMSNVLGFRPLTVALGYLPFSASLGAALAASAPLVTRHGYRRAAGAALVFGAAGLLLLSRVPVHGAYGPDVVPALLLLAFGLGVGLPALQNAALHGTTAGDAGLAAGVVACVQQLGAAAGLSVLATLAFRHTTAAVAAGVPDQVAAVAGYQHAFQAAGLVLVAGAALVLFMADRTHDARPQPTGDPASVPSLVLSPRRATRSTRPPCV